MTTSESAERHALRAELTAVLVRYRETNDPGALRRCRELRAWLRCFTTTPESRRIIARAAELSGWSESSDHSRHLGGRREPPPPRPRMPND